MRTAIRPTESPNRLIGMGQAPTNDNIQAVLQCGFTQVPVIEYVTWTVDLPVPDTAIPGTFGEQIDLLQNPKAVAGVTDVDSSFVMNGILQVDMLVIGFGVHIFAEPAMGTQIGNYMNNRSLLTSGSLPISPDAMCVGDASVLNLPYGGTLTPAELEWGVCAQEAAWHLANAYQFQWILQQRFLLFNELAADVAYFGSYSEAMGAGSSQQAFQRYVNRVNNKYAALGDPGIFLPVSAQRIGLAATSASAGTPVYHPTRAYDTIDVTYGGLRVQGLGTVTNPFRRLPKPVLLERGIPIGMLLQAQDQYHLTQFQNYISQTDQLGGTHTLMSVSSTLGGTTSADLQELTFPTTSANDTVVIATEQINTDRVLLKGGAMQIAILIKGFEIFGQWRNVVTEMIAKGIASNAAGGGLSGTRNALTGT